MPSRILGAAVAAGLLAGACSSTGSSTSTTPAPSTTTSVPVDDVSRTTFAPALNIHLDSMLRRPSGLYFQDLQVGTGSFVARGRTAVVRYSGWLANGKQFDSGEITVTLGTNKTIRAWEEGLLGMRVGGRRRLVVPPSLGYGSRGNGDIIPPSAVLVFEMELSSVM